MFDGMLLSNLVIHKCGGANFSKCSQPCGLKVNGTFGIKVYRNQTMNGALYHSLLQFTALPELEIRNGGNLNTLWCGSRMAHHAMLLITTWDIWTVSMRVELFAEEPLEGINSLDLFLKSQVYTPKPRYFNDLKLALEREVARVDVLRFTRWQLWI